MMYDVWCMMYDADESKFKTPGEGEVIIRSIKTFIIRLDWLSSKVP